MVTPVPERNADVVLRFGGGLSTRASPDEIDEREAAGTGDQNFRLDPDNRILRPREGLELAATHPNGKPVRGFGQLEKADGTRSTLVQSGGVVSEWDGSSAGFTQVGAVATTAKLRGPRSHNYVLNDVLILTDLSLQEQVKEWDGTTFRDVQHNLTGNLKAKYAAVFDERLLLAHVESNSVLTPHLITGSSRQDYTDFSTADRPGDAGLVADDAWFLPSPDLHAINGFINAFGRTVFSTLNGRLWYLDGTDATDFVVKELYGSSGVDGDEGLVFAGNDAVYGRNGALESLLSTDQFGDVQTDDLSRKIDDLIRVRSGWTMAYNQRLGRVYALHSDQGELWAFFKSMVGSQLSPWSRYKTAHGFGFQPTAMMSMIDPASGREMTFLGDSVGRVWRLESSTSADGGEDIKVIRTSKLFKAPLDAKAYDIEGWITYERVAPATVTLDVLWGGREVFDRSAVVSLPAPEGAAYFGGSYYFGGSTYFGAFGAGRFYREPFTLNGHGENWQVRVTVEGSGSFGIHEIGLRFLEAGRSSTNRADRRA